MEENEEKKETEQLNDQEVKENQESEKKETKQVNKQEVNEQQESEKKEQHEKNEPEEEKKSSKPKGKKTTKIIIVIILIIAILAGTGFGVYYYFANEDNLKWGNVYLEVLKDDDKKLEDLDDRKIQLLDLDKDSMPELIVYGTKNEVKNIANIFKINNKKEVDTIQLELDNEFDIKLLYNTEKEDYDWYTVAENKTDSTDEQDKKTVYDLNLDTEKHEPEKLDVNFNLDIVEVEDNYSKKVDFEKDLSKKEIEEVFEEAKEEYVETEDMITDEVKGKVEELKVYKNVKRPDKSKGLVYSVRKYENNYGNKYEYPTINIDSEDVKKINEKIEENYGFSEEEKEWLNEMELTEISYFYNVKGSYLSLIAKKGGNQSVWASSYVINLEDCMQLTSEALLGKENLDKSEVISKVKEVALKDYNAQIEKEKNSMGNYAWRTTRI